LSGVAKKPITANINGKTEIIDFELREVGGSVF
jgi:hypothetical protein